MKVVEVGTEISNKLHDAAKEEKVRDLEERDRQVREREQAHQSAAGSLAEGGPVYKYEIGPDGKQYAVEGHTRIKVRSGNTPEERIRNAKQAERAARAGGGTTPQSQRVAMEARQEIDKAEKEIEEKEKGSSGNNPHLNIQLKKAAETYRLIDNALSSETLRLD
jgi:hypothetical protein